MAEEGPLDEHPALPIPQAVMDGEYFDGNKKVLFGFKVVNSFAPLSLFRHQVSSSNMDNIRAGLHYGGDVHRS